MRYITESILGYIIEECKKSTGLTLRFVLPSYPAGLLFAIGRRIKEQILRIPNRSIRFHYGIAYELGQKWRKGTESEKNCFRLIQEQGWYNETDNLTNLRHIERQPTEDCLLVVLAGYQDIRDQSSLQDFFHLDQECLWNICLRKDFYSWVEAATQQFINPDGNEIAIRRIASILSEIYNHGLTDPLEVSRYLEAKDFSSAMDGTDALELVLSDLGHFGLPSMMGLAQRNNATFGTYIIAAQKFLNYSSFLDVSSRSKALERIDSFSRENMDEPPEHVLGIFPSKDELVNSLREYVETGCSAQRSRLAKADFVYIHDGILRYKSPKQRRRDDKDTITKLRGNPLEVFLRALWLSLAGFKKQNTNLLVLEDIESISLTSLEFIHQFGDDDKSASDYLQRLIGGIEQYLEGRLLIGPKEHPVSVELSLAPNIQALAFNRVRGNTEPRLIFEIRINGKTCDMVQRFAWLLGENTDARFLVELFDWLVVQYRHNVLLPAFSIQYIAELFMASSSEDVNRIFKNGLSSASIHELAPEPSEVGCHRNEIYDLAADFQRFLDEYSRTGFFSALMNKLDPLRHSYEDLLRTHLDKSSETRLGPRLLKAFMFVPKQFTEVRNWEGKDYLEHGVVTPLHPALLQMIHHQHAYMCEGFCNYVNEGLKEVGTKSLSVSKWNRLMDLSQVKWPILGLLDANGNLATHTRSYGYIHLVGTPRQGYSTSSSRLLFGYEDTEDEDITDAELFDESQGATLIKNVLLDFCKAYPYAGDGLSVGVYCGANVQPVISGINAFLSQIVADKKDHVYSLNLILLSSSFDDAIVLRWLRAWEERWQSALDGGKLDHYSNSKITLYFRVVPDNDFEQLAKQVQSIDVDVFFFTDFTRPEKSSFLPISDSRLLRSDQGDYLKFPIMQKAACTVREERASTERRLVLSNRQFTIGTLHAELMAKLRYQWTSTTNRHVIVASCDLAPWLRIIDVAHSNCVWVVCIDPLIDDKLIRGEDGSREIIGFGTGVGPHGELNFTVSTEQFYVSDLTRKIGDQLVRLLSNYDVNVCNQLAEELIKAAASMPGLSVVKATGPSEYVRDFIAYALVRKLLPRQEEMLCDEIISLDAFSHWFDLGPRDIRPDLLHLQAECKDGLIKIRAQIIECKFAKASEGYLERAITQVEEGLKQLIPKFRPRQCDEPIGVRDSHPPDQRYWWIQLHRLLSSHGEIEYKQSNELLQALELLSDGYYTIEWEAAVVAVWTDVMHGEVNRNERWCISMDGQDMPVYSVECGRDFIQEVVLNGAKFDLFPDDSAIRYDCTVRLPDEPTHQDADDARQESEQSKQIPVVPEKKTKTKPSIDTTSEMSERHIPDRILLGSGTSGGRDVYWEFGHPELPNRHLLIFGASGTGKTYTIQCLIAELSRFGINSLIVDYTTGFTNQQLERILVDKLAPLQHIVRTEPLPINPFRKQCEFVDDIPLYDTPTKVAQRVTGVFSEVFTLGEQQKAVLYESIKSGLEDTKGEFNLRMLLERLERIGKAGGVTASPAVTVANKIRPFVDMNPFGEEDPDGWERIFLDPVSRCHILQLAGFMKDAARLITEFSLIDLYWYYRTRGSKDDPRVVVLDEIQNLDHRLESPIGQFLTEGRKLGLSLILATQSLSNFSQDEKDRLFQASHKLFFKPADTEVKAFAQLIADATGEGQTIWIQRLSQLKRGECYSLGCAYNSVTNRLDVNKAFKIRIRPLEERL